MPERIAAAVREEPRRGLGLAAGLAVLIAAIVLLVSWLSGASGAAAKDHRSQQAGTHPARTHRHRGGTESLRPAQINAKVNRLLRRMTVKEKFDP